MLPRSNLAACKRFLAYTYFFLLDDTTLCDKTLASKVPKIMLQPTI